MKLSMDFSAETLEAERKGEREEGRERGKEGENRLKVLKEKNSNQDYYTQYSCVSEMEI